MLTGKQLTVRRSPAQKPVTPSVTLKVVKVEYSTALADFSGLRMT